MSTRVEEAADTSPLSVLGEALESAAEAFGDATSDARASAKVAARKVQQTFRKGIYKSAYGISFGLVFGAVFLVELLPEDSSLRRGFEDGATDALDAIASRKVQALPAGSAEELEEAAPGAGPHETESAR